MMPRLMYERLDELGLDFCVVYPTAGLGYYRLPPDDSMRRALCRAYNVFTADQFRPFSDRIIPAAIIPMYTPEEAIEELEFASKQLGYKVVHDRAASSAARCPRWRRSIPRRRSSSSGTTCIGIDSPHDYDPVWAKCRELQASRRASTTARARSCCATRRRTSATTTSATSPPPATPWPRRCSSAASRGASRS